MADEECGSGARNGGSGENSSPRLAAARVGNPTQQASVDEVSPADDVAGDGGSGGEELGEEADGMAAALSDEDGAVGDADRQGGLDDYDEDEGEWSNGEVDVEDKDEDFDRASDMHEVDEFDDEAVDDKAVSLEVQGVARTKVLDG